MFSPLTHDDPLRLGTYQPLARLGSGGMGTVYLARADSGRTAAVKTMHATIAGDPAFRTRFRLEVDAARVIGGVHGAQVFDADPLAETPWMATEYVLGPPLDDAVELTGPLPEPAVRALGARLCAALAQLHRSDVVHRDLKPSNIMLTLDGPKVIDFGIARAIGDERLTSTGAAAGTPAFMSPEQATGQEHTPAGDVFALAGVLTYAASGHGPFGSGQPADLLYRVRYAEPDLTGVPEALVPILSRCLAKAPRERPVTTDLAAQLTDDDHDFADLLPMPLLAEAARRATEVWRVTADRAPRPDDDPASGDPTRPTPSGMSRRRLLLTGGGSVAGVAAASVGAWVWLGRPERGGGGTPGPGTSPSPSASLPPKTDYDWQKQLSPPKGLPVPPTVFDHVGQSVVADGTRLRLLNTANGSVEVESLGSAPPHRVVPLSKEATRAGLYMSELTSDPTDGPLLLKTVIPSEGELEPDPVEVKGFNGSLRPTQLLCAAEKGDTVFICAGQGKSPESGFGFDSDQKWYLLAVDAKKGKVLWREPLPPRTELSQRLHFLAAQATSKHLVLLQETGNGDAVLSVRDIRTGELRWDEPLTSRQPERLRGQLMVEPIYGLVYPPVGPLRALRLSDGREEWSYGGVQSTRRGVPVLLENPATDSAVCAVLEGSGLVAVTLGEGEVVWREQQGRARAATATDAAVPPIVTSEYVYRRSGKEFIAFDTATGILGKHRTRLSGDRFFVLETLGEAPFRVLGVDENNVTAYRLP